LSVIGRCSGPAHLQNLYKADSCVVYTHMLSVTLHTTGVFFPGPLGGFNNNSWQLNCLFILHKLIFVMSLLF